MKLLHLFVLALLIVAISGCKSSAASKTESKPATTAATPAAPNKATPKEIAHEHVAPEGMEIAILAGGCFWGMEELLREIDGVTDTDVGYTGGSVSAPSYEDVKTGASGHAEAVRVVFDPQKISYSDLLEKWFFRMHDPTTHNKQGNDIGSQYRSAIFYTSADQQRVALEVIKRVNASAKWKAPVVTEVVAAGPFTNAEGYHQDYLQKNPNGYTCHFLREWDDV